MKRVIAFLITFLLTSVGYTQDPEPDNVSPYETVPEIEIPITIGMFIATGLPRLLEQPSAPCGLDCDPETINSLDRTVVGWHSATASTVSDVVFISGMVLHRYMGYGPC